MARLFMDDAPLPFQQARRAPIEVGGSEEFRLCTLVALGAGPSGARAVVAPERKALVGKCREILELEVELGRLKSGG